ncbi:MAG: hypothetical protein C0402_00540 [Thermodesulfovibrio sp.]|nr:hypothetical protein [Thermodesulfovibrio sp.]
MGETNAYQPLTKNDKVTVVLYRTGIVLSSGIIGLLGFLAFQNLYAPEATVPFLQSNFTLTVLLFKLYFSIGLSVFFIHLYVGKLYRFLKRIYYLAAVCLVGLVILGNGNPILPLFSRPAYGALLLVPAAFCLGFVTAKEAFCFRLYEGYILFALLPLYLLFYALGAFSPKGALQGIIVIAVMLVFFTLRKVFMPLHYDIGDKSAYTP